MNQGTPITPTNRQFRFCPHATLALILTPALWGTLVYLLMIR